MDQIGQLVGLSAERRLAMKVVATVLPFRVNQYILSELIDWSKVPDDPIFQLVFPQPGMLEQGHFDEVAELLKKDASRELLGPAVSRIRGKLNPHPAGQLEQNVPCVNGTPLPGIQHKYRETVLFFPAQGQTCHAYCSFCFRWPQFIGDKSLKFSSCDADQLIGYLSQQREVTDVLITGGDPMVMRASKFAGYLDALLRPELEHVSNIRIGSKALSFWPYRFVSDPDADDLLRALERVQEAGKQVSFMAHVNHWRELSTDVCRRAIRRIRATGAVIRTQAPLLRHINDDAAVWARMWREQVSLGIIPYYMFVERNTGAKRYFDVPLWRCYEVYRDAIASVPGLARTARGPSMSAAPGKVEVQGVVDVGGDKAFALRLIQARDPKLVQRPFFARYDERATWLNDLEPLPGTRFPF